MVLKIILLCIGSYFFGNISFARILASIKKGDITKSGSGNPGTMNMLRTYGVKAGIVTLVLDFLKAFIPCLIGKLILPEIGDLGVYISGVAVVIGHIYPVIYKFKGGKGIACSIGVFAVANPVVLLCFFVVAFAYLWFFDYGAIASFIIVTGLTCIQGYNYYQDFLNGMYTHEQYLALSILLFLIFGLTWFAHRTNISRMLLGKENKANLQYHIKKKMKKEQIKTIREEYKQTVGSQREKMKAKISVKKDEYRHEVDGLKLMYQNSPNMAPLLPKNKLKYQRLKHGKKSVYKLDKMYAKAEYKLKKKEIRKDYTQDKKEISNNLVESVFEDLQLKN